MYVANDCVIHVYQVLVQHGRGFSALCCGAQGGVEEGEECVLEPGTR